MKAWVRASPLFHLKNQHGEPSMAGSQNGKVACVGLVS